MTERPRLLKIAQEDRAVTCRVSGQHLQEIQIQPRGISDAVIWRREPRRQK